MRWKCDIQMSEQLLEFNLNGKLVRVKPFAGSTLLDVLKQDLGVISVKKGCETGECGACTVMLDGKPVDSCLVYAWKAHHHNVETLEGLSSQPVMKELQQNFAEKNALQCGYCTPGMLVTLYALMREKPEATSEEIKFAIEGNLCRCGAYLEIEQAVLRASQHFQHTKIEN